MRTIEQPLPFERERYTQDKFVARPKVDEVLEWLGSNLRRGAVKEAQVHTFQGVKGAGKSWLALHIHHTWRPIRDIKSFLISFDPACTQVTRGTESTKATAQGTEEESDKQGAGTIYCFNSGESERIVDDFINWLLKHLNHEVKGKQPTESELRTWLHRAINSMQEPLVIILDGLFEAGDDLLKQLEKTVLSVLLESPKCIILTMAQGKYAPWIDPRLAKAAISKLLPLNKVETSQQIEHQVESSVPYASVIATLGSGNPLNTLILARAVADKGVANGEMTPEDWESALQRVVEIILEDNKAESYAEAFKVLSVLDGFREDIIKPVWERYKAIKGAKPPPPSPRLLADTGLVRWESDRSNHDSRFFMDESLRCPMEWFLLLSDPYLWAALHCQARKTFQEWGRTVPQLQEFYSDRSKPHIEALGDSFECGKVEESPSAEQGELYKKLVQASEKGQNLLNLLQRSQVVQEGNNGSDTSETQTEETLEESDISVLVTHRDVSVERHGSKAVSDTSSAPLEKVGLNGNHNVKDVDQTADVSARTALSSRFQSTKTH